MTTRKFDLAETSKRFGFEAVENEVKTLCVHGKPEDDCFDCRIEKANKVVILGFCPNCTESMVYEGYCYVCNKQVA